MKINPEAIAGMVIENEQSLSEIARRFFPPDTDFNPNDVLKKFWGVTQISDDLVHSACISFFAKQGDQALFLAANAAWETRKKYWARLLSDPIIKTGQAEKFFGITRMLSAIQEKRMYMGRSFR